MSDADPFYRPSEEILHSYAEVLVKFALNSGKGVQPGEVVECIFPEVAQPLAREVHRIILEVGAHPMMQMQSQYFEHDFYQLSSAKQLEFFPKDYLKAKAQLISHVIYLIDPAHRELPAEVQNNLLTFRKNNHPYKEWLSVKELEEKFSWTVGIWGTEEAAEQAHISLQKYWEELIIGCCLDTPDPVGVWRETFQQLHQTCKALDDLKIERLHFSGADVNLVVELGSHRRWLGGRGRNIPSYEVFTSPDWRSTSGWVRSNQDLYYYGATIKGAEFYFTDGVVQEASAEVGGHTLEVLIQNPGMNKIGEISMTDKRISRVQHALGVTLFDENIGGDFGNFHFALGKSFPAAYTGKSLDELSELGFNQSALHMDFVSTSDRVVTATLRDQTKKIIYQNGMFTV